jgi:prepilin-type N-terminal cleavage/methylation domain-containing protein
MIRFKHLKPGMSLLEVIAAIAVLAIFGSSLFLMQQYLFERMIIAQTKLTAHLRMQTELVAYQKNILKEQIEHDGVVEKSLQPQIKNFKLPDMTITISTKSNIASKPTESAEQKQDGKESGWQKFTDLHLITAQAESNKKEYGKAYLFVYVPKVAKT